MVSILVPYCTSLVLAFVGVLEGVVDGRDDEEQVRERGGDSVGDYHASGIFTSWIDLSLLATVLGALRPVQPYPS